MAAQQPDDRRPQEQGQAGERLASAAEVAARGMRGLAGRSRRRAAAVVNRTTEQAARVTRQKRAAAQVALDGFAENMQMRWVQRQYEENAATAAELAYEDAAVERAAVQDLEDRQDSVSQARSMEERLTPRMYEADRQSDARWIRESRHRVDLRRSDELSAVFEAGREARNERLAGRVRMAEHNTDVGLSRTYDVPYRDGAGDEQHVRTVMTGQGGMRMLPVDPRATAEQKGLAAYKSDDDGRHVADKLDPRPPQNQAGATPSEAATPAPDAARASGGRSLPMPTGVVAPEASAATKGLAKVGQAQAWTPPVVKSPARAEPGASPWAGKIHAHHRETVRVTRGPGVSLDKPVSPARPERGTALNMERD